MIEQYKHKEIAVTQEMQGEFDRAVTVANAPVDATQRRITALEAALERQARQIRDLQSLVEHLQRR